MNKVLLIIAGIVIIAVVVGVLVWNMPSRAPLYDASPTDTYAPSTLVPEGAGIDDLTSEADTFDINFETDMQQLDAELKGL